MRKFVLLSIGLTLGLSAPALAQDDGLPTAAPSEGLPPAARPRPGFQNDFQLRGNELPADPSGAANNPAQGATNAGNVARARADAHPSPLQFHPKIDAPILGIAAAAWITGEVIQPQIIRQPACSPCLASTINPMDRGLAGQHNTTADYISYGTLGLSLALPLIGDAIDVARNGGGWKAYGTDMALLAEALSIDGALNQGVKLATQRPRPFVYGLSKGDPLLSASDSYASFFSEHTSMAFTAASFYTTLFAMRHPNSKGTAAAVGILAFGLAASTAALRVEAGKHFYTDVMAGAALGTVIGVAIPLLHRRKINLPIGLAPVKGGAIATFSIVNR